MSVYSESADGSLAQVSGSPFAAGMKPSSSTSLRQNTTNVVYVTNFASNSISGYTLGPTAGILSPMPGSPFPTEIGPISIASSFAWIYVASQGANGLAAYETGSDSALISLRGSPFAVGTSPDQVLFLGRPPVTIQ